MAEASPMRGPPVDSDDRAHPGRGVTLDLVRELGFDTVMYVGSRSEETVFFLGPQMADGRRTRGEHATEQAVREFIDYWENQLAVARDYLANGRNNRTHEWAHGGGRYGVRLVGSRWAAVNGGHDFAGSREEACALAKRWADEWAAEKRYPHEHEAFVVTPYTGGDPADREEIEGFLKEHGIDAGSARNL
jgi:hypothetical protein